MIQLGDRVKDTITGFTGIIIGRCEYLNGCVQYEVKPKVNEKGEMVDGKWIDEEQLIITKAIKKAKAKLSGGGNRSHPY